MEAVYGWVKNIIYYMIFLSVVNNLLADSKYGKYIRFFSGMVLILLVVSPFTGGLHLDEQISSMFKSISFQNDTDDLKQDLWGISICFVVKSFCVSCTLSIPSFRSV